MKIGYARVSTDDQNLDLQRDALKATGCDKIFEDTESGAKANRPGLLAALEYARKGDTLVAWRLDRLGRSLPDLVVLVAKLESTGVQLESLQERIDTGSATGKLVFHLFAALAEFERNLIRERTNAGLAAARARGRKGGRPALAQDTIDAARRLMADSNNSAAWVCKTLKISRTALYKYASPNAGTSS